MNLDADEIKVLARMAARLAGRDPDEHIKITLGHSTFFDGPMWTYPDFLERARVAYQALTEPTLGQARLAQSRPHSEALAP